MPLTPSRPPSKPNTQPTHYRDIPIVKVDGIDKIEGTAGKVTWLPLDLLVIDDRYQRPLTPQGRKLIRDIAQGFSWLRCTPLVVVRIEAGTMNGRYAIIDGQHRAAGAKARGDIHELPCWQISGEIKDQAEAFMSLNAPRNKVSGLAIWHAARTADDPDALHLFKVIAAADVVIPHQPVSPSDRPVNMTMAATTIMRLLKAHGDGPTIRTLRILRRAGEIKKAPALHQQIIAALGEIVGEGQLTFDDEDAALALSTIDVRDFDLKTRTKARGDSVPLGDVQIEAIEELLTRPPERKAA